MPIPFYSLRCPLSFILSFLSLLLVFPLPCAADIEPLQLIGTYENIRVPPFSPSCADGIRILQVDPLSSNDGVFFVIPHNRIQLTLQGGGAQSCLSSPVDAPRFSDSSATVLKRDTQSTLDANNTLVRAFSVAQERFFLGRELGPRLCAQSILPQDSVSMWVAPEVPINVPAGTYAINFKPGFKYIYYFSETDPCLFRGNANQQGTLRPVVVPSPSPLPSSAVLSPLPAPSASPLPAPPSPSSGTGNAAFSQDDGVTVADSEDVSTASACFPGDAVVTTSRGEIPIADLAVGDDVMVAKGAYSRVFAFTHASKRDRAQFVTIQTAKRTLALSPGHYMYGNGQAIRADNVRVGDRVWDVDEGDVLVRRVNMVTKHGLYNPQTMDGNIVVDGLVVTTYTTAVGGVMTAHALLAPIRMLGSCFRMNAFIERIRLLWIATR